VAHAYSELLEKERALRAAAEENDRRKDEYLAMLAHELRNPLAPLRNALYMLRRPDTLPAHQQWAWDVVRRQVRQLGQLVDGLIEGSLRHDGRDAIVEVRDTGAGISAVLLPRIFNLFEQADRPLDRGDGGLGIGLTLVRKLTELHGGSVTATSAGPGKGSCFT